MTLKEQIQSLYYEIQTHFQHLIISCNDENCFCIDYFPIDHVKHCLIELDSKINEYNIKTVISKDKIIDLNKDICVALNNIPDLNVTYLNHQLKAETIHKDFCQKETKMNKSAIISSRIFTESERALWHQASSFCHDSDKKHIYSNLQIEIDKLKASYCNSLNVKPWLKIKPGFAGKENINVTEFCDLLVGNGYFDQSNAEVFKRLLLGENIADNIIWLKLPADVCRVINCINVYNILTYKPQWSKFEKKFIIDGKIADNLKSAAQKTGSTAEIEEIVKKSFKLK